MGKTVAIVCTACGAEALLVREAKYEGLTRVGETLSCSACGHVYASEEEAPFKDRETSRVFTDDDRPEKIELFTEDDKGRFCRYCVEYVVNPFMQWCGLHKKEVEATDTCAQFKPKPDEAQAEEEGPL
jgi:rubredoxin